jgi:hypothetical protein
MGARLLEITDLLWPVDAGGIRVPVMKADVVDALRARGQRGAARIVSAIPAASGVLDPGYSDSGRSFSSADASPRCCARSRKEWAGTAPARYGSST